MLADALELGVVRKVTHTRPRNANKRFKSLAPWFSDACRTAKHVYQAEVRSSGRDSPSSLSAFRNFRKICHVAKSKFSSMLPDMTKYMPKQFWGFIGQKAPNECSVLPATFASYCNQLFRDSAAGPGALPAPLGANFACFERSEVEYALTSCFKGNVSSSLSPLPF